MEVRLYRITYDECTLDGWKMKDSFHTDVFGERSVKVAGIIVADISKLLFGQDAYPSKEKVSKSLYL